MKRNSICRLAGWWVAAVCVGGSAAQAQYSGNFQTNFVNAVTNVAYASTDYIIGNGYAGDGLIVTNAGWLVATNGVLGLNGTDNNNWALVTGAGSVWSNSSGLYVGYDGSGNTLTIANGGTVLNNDLGRIGYDPGANSNTVLVTGAGSLWNVANQIVIGEDVNTGNNLSILNGGRVISDSGLIGDYSSGSYRNWAQVSGAGSLWSNRTFLVVGNFGFGHTLTIANGGTVLDADGYVGAGASSNTVTVTGSGSAWTNSGDCFVGWYGAGNTLAITNDGTVVARGNMTISTYGGASNNVVNMSSGQLNVGGSLNIGVGDSGAFNLAGGTAQVGGLVATNGAKSVINFNGGTLITHGCVVNNGQDFVIGATGGNAKYVALSGTHTFSNNLVVGQGSSDNQLIISNAAMVFARSVIVGANAGSGNNTLAISEASLIATNAGVGVVDVRRGAVTIESGTFMANTLLLTNGANGTLNMAGGMFSVNVMTNNGVANMQVSGGTLRALDSDADWAVAIQLNGTVTINAADISWHARNLNLSGALSGLGGFIKSGGGTLNLSGTNTLSGAVAVTEGNVTVGAGSGVGSGALSIAAACKLDTTAMGHSLDLVSGQTLTNLGTFANAGLVINNGAFVTGNGSYIGPVTNKSGGFLSPGIGGDTNKFTALAVGGGSTNVFFIGVTYATHDMSVVSNSLSLADSGHPLLRLNLADYVENLADANKVIVLYDNLGTNGLDGISSFFLLSDPSGSENGANLVNGKAFRAVGDSLSAGPGFAFTIHYDFDVDSQTFGTGGNDIALTVIPEPVAGGILLLLGGGLLGWHRLRRWRA